MQQDPEARPADPDPYAASSAPVAPEEIPPFRFRFWGICFTCSFAEIVLLNWIFRAEPPPHVTAPALVAAWLVPMAWIFYPELRQRRGFALISGWRFIGMSIAFLVVTYAFVLVDVVFFALVLADYFA